VLSASAARRLVAVLSARFVRSFARPAVIPPSRTTDKPTERRLRALGERVRP
jgi:hypothetical protein